MKILITIIQILLLAAVFGMLGVALQAKKHHSTFLPPSPEWVANELLKSHDADENGLISLEELLSGLRAFHEKRMGQRPPKPSSEQRNSRGPEKMLTELSAAFDVNNDNQLSQQELILLLESLHQHAPRSHPRKEAENTEAISPY